MKKALTIFLIALCGMSVATPVRSMVAAKSIGTIAGNTAKYTVKDYVQDGLVCIWDAIENVGYGQHDGNATVWKELISGTNNFTITNPSKWTKNAIITRPAIKSQSRIPGGVLTLEIVMDWGAWNTSTTSMDTRLYIPVNNPSVGTWKNTVMLKFIPGVYQSQRVLFLGSYQRLPIVGDYFPRQISCSFGLDGIMTDIYFDGEPATLGPYEYQYNTTSVINLGCPNADGKIHCIRAYEGRISLETREANYAIDKVRFNLP